MSGSNLIKEWQYLLKQKYRKDISKDRLLTCIILISNRHKISTVDSILVLDKLITGEEKVFIKEAPLEDILVPKEHIEGIPMKGISIDCQNIGHLENFNNSCYMDSVLFALLVIPNKFINDEILNKKLVKNFPRCTIKARCDIQKALRELKKDILSGKRSKCINFRRLLGQCYIQGFEDFSRYNERDADEFLKYLFSMFEVEKGHYIKYTYGTNKVQGKITNMDVTLTSKIHIKDTSPVFDINYQTLLRIKPGSTLSHIINIPDDSGILDEPLRAKRKLFKRRIEYIKLYNYDYLVINLQRSLPEGRGRYIDKKVIPNETLTLSNGKILQLNAIVIWFPGHYVAMLRCSSSEHTGNGNGPNGNGPNGWWYYNDLSNQLDKIGSYSQMLKYDRSSTQTNGTLFFYV